MGTGYGGVVAVWCMLRLKGTRKRVRVGGQSVPKYAVRFAKWFPSVDRGYAQQVYVRAHTFCRYWADFRLCPGYATSEGQWNMYAHG